MAKKVIEKHLLMVCLICIVPNRHNMVTGQSATHIKLCPSMCICDAIERFVLCQDNNLYHVPLPLPNGTKLLDLSKNEFTSLSNNTFKGWAVNSTLESLVLYDNKIQYIRPYSFINVRNLKNFWLFGNRLTTLAAYTFARLEALEDLDLSRNSISYIERNAFFGLKKLQVLQLWGNALVSLEAGSFNGLENLSNLTLGDNMFEKIPSQAFTNLKNLTSLEMLNLPVEEIQANAFQSLPTLEKLHIGDWPLLQRIDDESFTNLSSLTYISLYRCNLLSVPYKALLPLTSLRQLLLSNNPLIEKLTEKDFSTLHNLEELYLSNVGVHAMHDSPFRMLTNLQILDLSQNHLVTLPSHIFLQLENLRSLNLSDNYITVLTPSAFITLNKINIIDLSHNKLICDCDMKWLKSLQELKIREHFVLNGKCSDPHKYNGFDIVKLPPRKFVCEPPSFSDEKKSIMIKKMAGLQASLPCSPDHGVPTPEMQWSKKKKVLNDIPGYAVSKNGSLLIERLSEKDGGKYICNASNKFGFARIVVTLRVLPNPKIPNIGEKSSGATTGIAVTTSIIIIGIIAYCFISRNFHQKFKSRFYDPMNDSEDMLTQRLSMKNGPKLS